MERLSFIDRIVNSKELEDKKIIEKFLDRLDTVLSSYDDFTEEIFSDIFYELYLNETKESYLKIATKYNISTSKVSEIKKKIEQYSIKLIYKSSDFYALKKYLY